MGKEVLLHVSMCCRVARSTQDLHPTFHAHLVEGRRVRGIIRPASRLLLLLLLSSWPCRPARHPQVRHPQVRHPQEAPKRH